MTTSNTDKKIYKSQARFAGYLSIVVNILLFIFKFWVGIQANSVAIIADAWHSLSDSLTSVILLFGLKISDKPADKEHPFGHGRSELIASLIIAILLAVVAFEFFWKSIERLDSHDPAKYGTLALWAMIITVVCKEAMAQYAFRVSRRSGIVSLRADAWHHRSDAISSIIILAGIIFARQVWWLDGAMGIIVAGIIMYAAFNILKSAVGPLLGRSPDKDLVEKVKIICEKHGGDEVYVHHLHIHDYGNHTELTFHIHFDGQMSLENAHAVTKQIEFELLKELKIAATIHMEPELPESAKKDILR